jgi:hypothetical protein
MSDAPGLPVPPRLSRARLTVTCGPLARRLTGRLAAALAAETTLPLDRAQEAVLVAEALADRCADLTPDGEMTVTVDVRAAALTIRLGPLPRGNAGRMLAADSGGPGTLHALASSVETRRLRSGRESLVAVIGPHPGDGTSAGVDEGASGYSGA